MLRPGGPLYTWVKKGTPRPKGTEPTGPSPAKQYQPFPGATWFSMDRKSPIGARMHDCLVAVGCSRYQSSQDKDVIGSGGCRLVRGVAAAIRLHRKAATWPPGSTTWDLLRVPKD
ncbi:hypothetical protein [Streptomyces sp. NEAU-174]|uniref:hypothetical protein n=1 Tax=Streptomyces sp. NEAU-174 TaxID=3458254 RepID=UPI004045021B